MGTKPLTIAVTGLNATDNPAPGVGVLRALREGDHTEDQLVGFAYDSLDPGVYAKDIVGDVFLLPYPSSSPEALFARIEAIHEQQHLDVIVPTLDAELPAFIALEPRLRELGIGMLLPTREQFDLRSKANLAELGRRAGIKVPRTVVVTSGAELAQVHDRVAYPFLVKGVFYGATMVYTLDEALAAFHKVAAQWGLPVIVQACVYGEELNLIALGDGGGGMLGSVAMKKMLLTDKGKGWAGITIRDPELTDVAERFVKATHWNGPCEVEVMRDKAGTYHLLEINPRFPAWVYLSAAAGVNLPRAYVELAAGREPAALGDYAVGKMFVRISLDQIADLQDFERIVTHGELHRSEGAKGAEGQMPSVDNE